MAFFNKLNDLAKNIGDKTGDVLETGKLNAKILSEKNAAAAEIKKIGEYYYQLYASGGEVAQEVLEFCEAAKAHFDVIAEAQAEIDGIKTAKEEAPAAAPIQTQQSRFCPECGTSVAADTKFCANCGHKFEVQEEPQETACPECGTVVEPGTRFCGNCGHKMD